MALCSLLAFGAAGVTSAPEPSPAYTAARDKILQEQCQSSVGGRLTLSPTEQRADAVLRAAKRIAYDSPDNFLPTRSFFETRDLLSRSRLFDLLRPLPKGAALHLHWDSLLPTSFFVNVTHAEPNCHVCGR